MTALTNEWFVFNAGTVDKKTCNKIKKWASKKWVSAAVDTSQGTTKEEMISDGIENSLQYIDNFDPEKSKNPFAYFTQIIYYAFIRRIAKEKKQQKIKDRILKRSNIQDMIVVQDHDDEADYQTQYIEFLDKYSFSDDDDDDDKKKK